MVTLVLISVAIVFANAVNELGALILLGGPSFLATFTKPQLDSLAYLLLQMHDQGIGVITQVFWGLWLVPFGLLVIRSGFLPKILGVLLLASAAEVRSPPWATCFGSPWACSRGSTHPFYVPSRTS